MAQFGIRDIVLVVAAALGLCRLMGHGPYQQVEHGQLTHLRPVLLLTVGIILVLVAVAQMTQPVKESQLLLVTAVRDTHGLMV